VLCKTFKIDGADFTEHAHETGLSVSYTPVAALPEKYTMDGTLHDDVLKKKAVYSIRLNPVDPDTGREILEAYNRPHVFLTIYDPAAGVEKTVLCKTAAASASVELVEHGEAAYWQIGDLTFAEM